MIDIEAIRHQVQRNCSISDARHAGLFSICGLALRLRDLYKWQMELEPWEEGDPGHLLDWIDHRERRWEDLAEEEFLPLRVDQRHIDPFDTHTINARLLPEGYFYGAGYAHNLKPTFFLAVCSDRDQVCSTPRYRLGCEMARDLLSLPALLQDGCIVLRRQAARTHLWDAISYLKKSARPALNYALEAMGVPTGNPQALRNAFESLVAVRQEAHTRHELAELRDGVFDPDVWREIVSAFPHSPVELLARAIRDFLADTHPLGPLEQIIRRQESTALGLHVAFFDGMSDTLFPEHRSAFNAFRTTGDWEIMRRATQNGRAAAADLARRLCELYAAGRRRDDLPWVRRQVESELLGLPSQDRPTGDRGDGD
jgi:hypothetical protein